MSFMRKEIKTYALIIKIRSILIKFYLFSIFLLICFLPFLFISYDTVIKYNLQGLSNIILFSYILIFLLSSFGLMFFLIFEIIYKDFNRKPLFDKKTFKFDKKTFKNLLVLILYLPFITLVIMGIFGTIDSAINTNKWSCADGAVEYECNPVSSTLVGVIWIPLIYGLFFAYILFPITISISLIYFLILKFRNKNKEIKTETKNRTK